MRVERGEKALDLMEQLIKGRMWLAGDALSVADIALVAYTRLAHEGGFDLTTRPRVMAWIMRAEMALGLPPAGSH
jgi:glutathione S-transferase